MSNNRSSPSTNQRRRKSDHPRIAATIHDPRSYLPLPRTRGRGQGEGAVDGSLKAVAAPPLPGAPPASPTTGATSLLHRESAVETLPLFTLPLVRITSHIAFNCEALVVGRHGNLGNSSDHLPEIGHSLRPNLATEQRVVP